MEKLVDETRTTPSQAQEDNSSEKPFWEPDITAAGIGKTGKKIINLTDTQTRAERITNPEPGEVNDTDFLILTADISKPQNRRQASKLLENTRAQYTVFFAGGRTQHPETLVEETDLLFPVNQLTRYPWLTSTAITDLFECMMSPTVQELGHGDIQITVGKDRIGRLFIDSLEDTSQLDEVTASIQNGSVDAKLLFTCYNGPYPEPSIERKVQGYERPDNAAYFWDPRIHPRYEERPHIKRITTFDSSQETMAQALTQN